MNENENVRNDCRSSESGRSADGRITCELRYDRNDINVLVNLFGKTLRGKLYRSIRGKNNELNSPVYIRRNQDKIIEVVLHMVYNHIRMCRELGVTITEYIAMVEEYLLNKPIDLNIGDIGRVVVKFDEFKLDRIISMNPDHCDDMPLALECASFFTYEEHMYTNFYIEFND